MPDVNVDLHYFLHFKTKRLVTRLGWGADVLPIKLWSFCGQHAADSGRLKGFSVAEIEMAVEWSGALGEAEKALIDLGWMVRDGSDYVVCGWHEHQGHIAAFSVRGKKAAIRRWEKVKGDDATSIAKDGASITTSIAQPHAEQCSNYLTNGTNLTDGKHDGLPGELAAELGLAANLGGKARGDWQTLCGTYPADSVRQAGRLAASASVPPGPAFVAYVAKVLGSRQAETALRIKPAAKPAVRQDC